MENNKRRIKRSGEHIVVPEPMKLDDAITIIEQQRDFEEQQVVIAHVFDHVPPPDSAIALYNCLLDEFSWAAAESTFSLFGERPPVLRSIKAGPNGELAAFPQGKFSMATIENTPCTIQSNSQQTLFSVHCKRKYKARFDRVIQKAHERAARESIYRHKALTFDLTYDKEIDEHVLDLDFMRMSHVDSLILPRQVERDLQANIWTLMEKPEACERLGIPTKRAVLMYGDYGVGKTLAAQRTAHIAQRTGHTFIYVQNADQIDDAYQLALKLSPSILFVEDIDRYMEDKSYVATLSTILDGIDTKSSKVMLITTTNHAESLPAILLRPGRIDASIEFSPPDAETVIRLINYYAPTIEGDLSKPSKILAGKIPAVIREACERSKLFALASDSKVVNADHLLDAANSMERQNEMLRIATEAKKEKHTVGDELHKALYVAVKSAPKANGAGKKELPTL